MLHVIWCNFCSIFRNDPEFHSTTWLALFSFLIGFLLTLLGLKYQSSGVSLFHTHGAILLLLIIDVCIFTITMVMIMLASSNKSRLHLLKIVFFISGTFACNLLLLILVPLFGWFIFTIFVFVLVWLLYGSYNKIPQYCQDIHEPIWHSTSKAFYNLSGKFRQSFQSIWKTPSQSSNGSLTETTNVEHRQVVGSTDNV